MVISELEIERFYTEVGDILLDLTKTIDDNHLQIRRQISQLQQDLLVLEKKLSILENKKHDQI